MKRFETSVALESLGVKPDDSIVGFEILNGKITLHVIRHESPPAKPLPESKQEELSFTQRWGGTCPVVIDPDDVIISRINERHVK